MSKYETIFIAQPELGEEELKSLTEKVREIIASMKGECNRLEDWGIRKLAYPVKKCQKGRYFYLNYAAGPDLIAELERRLRLDDKVIRYQSVKLDKDVEMVPAQEEKPVVQETATEKTEVTSAKE